MAKIGLKLALGGLNCPQYVRVEHKSCRTMCGTPAQAILDRKKLTGLEGGNQGRSKSAPEMAQIWLWCPPKTPKCVKDP